MRFDIQGNPGCPGGHVTLQPPPAHRPSMPRNPSETQLEDGIIAMAKLQGWRVHHQRPGLNRSGKWSSQIKGHKGFPDLVLAHPKRRRVLIVELKSAKGKLSDDQVLWAEALEGTVEYMVWTPTEWFDGTIDSFLLPS